MVLETVAMETLATAATVRMSGVFVADLREAFRGTNGSYSRERTDVKAMVLHLRGDCIGDWDFLSEGVGTVGDFGFLELISKHVVRHYPYGTGLFN